jgi:phosphoglycerate dehydrogenase-like enzyme
MKKRIFIDFALSEDILKLLLEGTKGHELLFPQKPVTSVLHKAEWDPQLAAADIIFGQPDVDSIAGAERLKWIHVSSSGITRYDTEQFRSDMLKRKIQVSNSAGVYNEACADHTLAFMLAQSRQLPLGLKTRAAGGTEIWHRLRGASVPLREQSVLIVGYGAIGKRLVELLRPFDMNMIAYRRKARGDEGVPVTTKDQLSGALAQADHVIDILPDSAETHHFFEAGRFAAIKPDAVFYNIGRGTTVDQNALLDTLRSGHLKAAWLDVTDPEPLPDNHPLRAEANCFITPHVAGGHFQETKTLVQHFLVNFKRFMAGEKLLDRVM